MISSQPAGLRMRSLLAALGTGTLALAGCSTSMAPVQSSTALPQAASVSGRVHGGNQPVAGATVTLYRAGQNGFATGGTAIAHTTSAGDGYGSFAFTENQSSGNSNSDNTFSCLVNGTDTNPYLYLVARGGTTVNSAGAVANPNAVFIAPMGPCDAVTTSTFVSMSEVVTVATMAAIHQFMNPSTSPIETTIGGDGVFVSTEALSNAFNGVSNMVSLANGTGNAPFTKTGSSVNGSVGVVVTITPEVAKINQLANAISSCINYSGSGNPNCTTIFNNAIPPASASSTSVPGASYSTPTDLLTALYYIFTNPTSGGSTARQNIYNLSTAAGAPYQPTLSALPSDWSIGVAYSSNSSCTDISGSTAGFINTPYSLDIDRYGDVWIGNNQAGAGSLGHLQANGQPTSCTTLTANNSPNGASAGTASTTVDTNGNIYSGLIRSNDLYRVVPSNSTLSTPTDIPTPEPIQALAADGNGNIFYATTAGNLYEIANAASTSSYTLASSVKINNMSLGTPTRMLVDAANRIWVSSGGNYVTYTQLNSSNAYVTTQVATTALVTDVTMGPAIGGATQVYTVNSGTNSVLNFSINGSNATTQNAALSGGGLSNPPALALDGAGNVWVANNTLNSVSGFTSTGTSLTSTTGLQKSSTYFNGSHGITVDAGGNIWVATGTNTVSEIVGMAVPVYKSYAIGLQTNRFQTLP